METDYRLNAIELEKDDSVLLMSDEMTISREESVLIHPFILAIQQVMIRAHLQATLISIDVLSNHPAFSRSPHQSQDTHLSSEELRQRQR